MIKSKSFRANGKLMLTGEYFVLHGAKSLAIPVNKGQTMTVEELNPTSKATINWEANMPEKKWFSVDFDLPDLTIIKTDDQQKASKLQLILLTLQQLNPRAFQPNTAYKFTTTLEFLPEWGFGSSSSLLVNLARWAKVNPYTLLNFSIGGSGYDIACGQSSQPLIYQLEGILPHQQKISFNPPFSKNLYFVFQGKKQDSAKGIRAFAKKNENKNLIKQVEYITEITEELSKTSDFEKFCNLLQQHEQLVSEHIGIPPIQTDYPDFRGAMKSLGAWGGDFLLASTPWSEDIVRQYFKQNNLPILFSFDELTIKS
ncbi:MAG: GYDIA family GHMP kinase [Bacteroidetes bacterium]|nr:GYDIA family GHMP kinase [Bacteroidota bacterium]